MNVPLAELGLEFLFWPARRRWYKPFFRDSNKFDVHPNATVHLSTEDKQCHST